MNSTIFEYERLLTICVAFSTATNTVPSTDGIRNIGASSPQAEQTAEVVKRDHLQVTDDLGQDKPLGKSDELNPKESINAYSVMNTPTVLASSSVNTMTLESSDRASFHTFPGLEFSSLLPEEHDTQASNVHHHQLDLEDTHKAEKMHTCTMKRETRHEK